MIKLPSFNILWWGSIGLVLVTSLSYAQYYHRRYREAFRSNQRLQLQINQNEYQLKMQRVRQQQLVDLDNQYTKEITHEEAHLAILEQHVRLGKRRLQFQATCQATTGRTAPTRLVNATAPRLTDSAQRDYLTLRRRIIVIQAQVKGLQDYIRWLHQSGEKSM
ncbi:lysis protein [Xenorhabdus nematophila]|uniref:lysis protein n=1 Tax=Xenorhabdus nematophila TaxID=628 RepID=UPI0003275A9C|nr:lysis protein [Xenorhabdus nematophila]CCW32404.1 putative Phosphoprotein phosphatase [Xenorhabdus nematophila F1]